MSPTQPIRSFFGGVGLAFPIHGLLLLNGNVFGISGFFHRALRGDIEAMVAVSGLVLGGIFIGVLEGPAGQVALGTFPQILVSGFLVGLGTKVYSGYEHLSFPHCSCGIQLSNGCTSG